jgi:vacuolar iron transporter family protein
MIDNHSPVSQYPREVLRHYLSDIIYGANDGIITTFTVISGVEGAKLSPLIVIIIGFVSLFGDGVSMGASRFLSIRAAASAHGADRGYIEPFYHAFVTFLAFFMFGLLPLLSFLIPNIQHMQFALSACATAVALFVVGSLRVFVTKKAWLRGGLEMLLIGGVVAVLAYAVGFYIKSLV